MKKWIMLVFLVWGAAGGVRAQEMVAAGIAKEASRSSAVSLRRAATANVSPDSSEDFSGAAAESTSWNELGGAKLAAPKFAGTNLAAPVASAAMAAPAPQVSYRDTEIARWELGLGFTYVKFRSPAIDQNMVGLNTSVAYFPREWLGVEGNITAAFGGTIFANERTKYGGFTGGPKIVMRQRRWEPWVHALVGMAHVNPQLAGVGKNGVAIQVGGGADYTLSGPLAVRMEGDWVLTHLYSQLQNNFQLVTGLVLHF
jgi:opacity protein-like surface antigen